MRRHGIAPDTVVADLLPRLVRFGPNITAAAFSLMKLLPARYILDRAAERGEVGPGTPVIETSSGTFALGLARVCALRGHPLTIVTDDAVDILLQQRLEQLHAQVVVVKRAATSGGFQQARLDRLYELQAAQPGMFWTRQYENSDNSDSYAHVAELVCDQGRLPDILVGPVGSGGSLCGLARFLRLVQPQLRVVAVDTPGSVVFGQPDRPRALRGLGNSLVPPNVEHAAIDEVHWVGAAEAFVSTRNLYAAHAAYVGPTSGAAYLVARWWAREQPDAEILVVFPDDGHRYSTTVYSDEWLASKNLRLTEIPVAPSRVNHPRNGSAGWGWFPWMRRTYMEVMGVEPPRVGVRS